MVKINNRQRLGKLQNKKRKLCKSKKTEWIEKRMNEIEKENKRNNPTPLQIPKEEKKTPNDKYRRRKMEEAL